MAERRGRRCQDLQNQIVHLNQSRPTPIIITSSATTPVSPTFVLSPAVAPPNSAAQAIPSSQFSPPPPMLSMVTSQEKVPTPVVSSGSQNPAPPSNYSAGNVISPVVHDPPAPVDVTEPNNTVPSDDTPSSALPPPPGPNASSPLEELAQTQPFLDLMTKAFEQVSGLPQIEYVCTFCRRKAAADADPVIYPHDTVALMAHCKAQHPKLFAFALNLVITDS